MAWSNGTVGTPLHDYKLSAANPGLPTNGHYRQVACLRQICRSNVSVERPESLRLEKFRLAEALLTGENLGFRQNLALLP